MHFIMDGLPAVALLAALAFVHTVHAEEAPRYWDFNGDGEEDIWYEDAEPGLSYLEYWDRNFDGKDDLRTQYDSNSHWPLGGFSDDDFDGTFETRHVYKDGQMYATVADSDGDMHYDIAHFYEAGLVTKSIRYTRDRRKSMLITLTYEFEFPISTAQQETSESPAEFHQYLRSAMPQSQRMPLNRSN